MQPPKLRDNKSQRQFELYPLGELPESAIKIIGKMLVYRYLVGQRDISGGDWGDIFASAINGAHHDSPLGIADVVHTTMAWSVKTVISAHPHKQSEVRIISGRCSPDYSYGISDLRADMTKTGIAAISIYNERINLAKSEYEPLRTCILVRNFGKMEFMYFENDTQRYNVNDYEWRENSQRNYEGYDVIHDKHKFTFQPHGAQLTIKYDVPASAIRFKVKPPPVLDMDKALEQVGYSDDWITIE